MGWIEQQMSHDVNPEDILTYMIPHAQLVKLFCLYLSTFWHEFPMGCVCFINCSKIKKKKPHLNLHQHSYPSSYSYKSFHLVSSVKIKIVMNLLAFQWFLYRYVVNQHR